MIFILLLNLPITVCVQAIVALCCACGKAMALARCYGLFKIIEMHENAFFHNKANLTFHQII